MTKNNFVVYTEWWESIKHLSVEQKAELLDAMFLYHKGEVNECSPVVNMALTFMKAQFERDKLKYEESAERSRLNGSKGGRPKSDKNANNKKPTGFSEKGQVNSKPRKPDDVDVDVDDDVDVDVLLKEITSNEVQKKKTNQDDSFKFNEGLFSQHWYEIAVEKGFTNEQLEDTCTLFADYYTNGKGKSNKSSQRGWDARWRRWLDNERTNFGKKTGGGNKYQNQLDGFARAVANLRARENSGG